MRKTTYIWFAVVLSLFTIGAFAGHHEAKKQEGENTTNEGEKSAGDQNIAYLAVSGELARLAAESQDAILMLAAARLEAMAATETTSRDKTTTGDASEADEKSKPEKGDLYELAKQFAGTNEALHALIADSQASVKTRGATGGAKSGYSSVRAYDTDVYRITFRGGRFAEVSVLGDGDTDLDLYVYDENGNQVCSDTDYTDQTYCSWRPRWTGSFRIEIKNLGRVYNEYRIITN